MNNDVIDRPITAREIIQLASKWLVNYKVGSVKSWLRIVQYIRDVTTTTGQITKQQVYQYARQQLAIDLTDPNPKIRQNAKLKAKYFDVEDYSKLDAELCSKLHIMI